ncbi:hypothetical protein WI1_00445, partial [Escherichia coli KTE97]
NKFKRSDIVFLFIIRHYVLLVCD